MVVDDIGLKLKTGDTLQLQTLGEDPAMRYVARVIGYLPEHSLLITTPRHSRKLILVREGQMFAVRLLTSSHALGFTATVLKSQSQPFPYLHLTYPRELETIVIRKAQRADVHLIVAIQLQDQAYTIAGHLCDLSISGARLSSKTALGKVGDQLYINVQLKVGKVEQYIKLPAVIRNLKPDKSAGPDETENLEHGYGIEFQDVPDQVYLVLYGFVYGHIAGIN